jgi:DNA recombination protein RmuC
MDPISIALGLLAVAGIAGTIWLARGRVKLAADAAGARADAASRLEYVNKLQLAWDEREAEVSRLRGELASANSDLRAAEERHKGELSRINSLMEERDSALRERERELRDWVTQRTDDFKNAFGKLSGDALRAASGEFLKLAETKLKEQQQLGAADIERRRAAVDELVKPIAETLRKTEAKLGELDKSRVETAASLNEQLRAAADSSRLLREETSKLVRALREPHVRGRYGELQLRRVAELAGMSAYCDFEEQQRTIDSDGVARRPDMVVRLPNERVVVVDAKTNIQAYLDALQAATPADAEACLDRFARHVAEQATALAKKKYWTDYEGSPEFVVMFIPGDQFIDAALSRQPELLEHAARQCVLLAGPAMLIGLLRAVAVGYSEQRLARAAAELRDLGIEFHDRAAAAFAHIAKVGAALNTAVDKYNEFVGSYERRLEPTLRKFEEAGARSGKELPEVKVVDVKARVVATNAGLLTPG